MYIDEWPIRQEKHPVAVAVAAENQVLANRVEGVAAVAVAVVVAAADAEVTSAVVQELPISQ